MLLAGLGAKKWGGIETTLLEAVDRINGKLVNALDCYWTLYQQVITLHKKNFKKWRSVLTISVSANKKTIGRLHIENRYLASKTWGSKKFLFLRPSWHLGKNFYHHRLWLFICWKKVSFFLFLPQTKRWTARPWIWLLARNWWTTVRCQAMSQRSMNYAFN